MPPILLLPGRPRRKNTANRPTGGAIGPAPAQKSALGGFGQRLRRLRQRTRQTLNRNVASPSRPSAPAIRPSAPASRPPAPAPASRPTRPPASRQARPSVILSDFFDDTPPTREDSRGGPPLASNQSYNPLPAHSPELTAPTYFGFELPETLAESGLAPRSRRNFRTQAGRNFVTRSPGLITPGSPTTEAEAETDEEGFELDPDNGPYISMFEEEPAVSARGGAGPQTVADQIRARRPYTNAGNGSGRPRVVGDDPLDLLGLDDLEEDEQEVLAAQTQPAPPSAPEPLVNEPSYDPNRRGLRRRGRRSSRRLLHFHNPAVAIIAGLLSLLILAAMVALIYYLGRQIDKAPPEKFSVLFSPFGEGQGRAETEGQAWARTFQTNFLERGGIAQPDVRSVGGEVGLDDEALKLAQRTQVDVVVSGYHDPKNGNLYARLTFNPNGPYDPPNGQGRRELERQLFEPQQIIFVTPPPTETKPDARLPLVTLLHALSAYYTGNYDSAVAELTDLLKGSVPENEPGLRMLRGNALFAFHKYTEAIEDYNQVVNINAAALANNKPLPINPAFVQNNRGVALNLQGNLKLANEAFEASLAVRNDLPKVFTNYAQFLVTRTDFEFRPAVVADWQGRLNNALKLDPKSVAGHYYLAQTYQMQLKYDEALASYNRARELDGNFLPLYNGMGQTYLAKFERGGDADALRGALDVFRWGESRASALETQDRERKQALDVAGNQTLAAVWDARAREDDAILQQLRFGIGRVFLNRTRLSGKDLGNPFDRLVRAVKSEKTPYEEAGPRLQEILKNQPNNPDAQFYYGQFLDFTGDGDPLPYYRKAKELEKNLDRRFIYHQILAEQYADKAQRKEAQNEYVQYINLDPNRAKGWLALSALQYRFGLYKEAAVSADGAIRADPRDPMTYLAAGAAQIGQVQLEQGIAYLDRALLLNPQLGEALLQKGIALFNLNRRNEALAVLSEALKVNPNFAQAHYYAGIVYYENRKETPNAQAEWEKAVAIKPDYAEAWSKLGLLHSQLNQLDAAINAYNQALKANDKDAPNHYYLGLLYETRNVDKDLERAEAQYRRAIELQPGLVNAYYRLALVIRLRGGKTDDALDLALKATRLDPRNAEAQVALGDVRRARNEFAEALPAYNAALALRKDYPDALYGRAATYLGLKQFDPALTDINRGLALKSGWADAYLLQARILVAKNQLDAALVAIEQARLYDPANPNLLVETGREQELRGDFEAAIKAYEKSLEIYEPNAEAHFRLGELYFTKHPDRTDVATRHFERVGQLDSRWPRLNYWLGRCYARLNRYNDAQSVLEKMVQQDPQFVEAHFELGNIYRVKGLRDTALAQYDEALKLQPAFGPAWLNKGQVYEEQVNIPKAIEAYRNALKDPNNEQVRAAASAALSRLGS